MPTSEQLEDYISILLNYCLKTSNHARIRAKNTHCVMQWVLNAKL